MARRSKGRIFFYRLCPTTIREWANGHVDMCRPVVRGPASTYLMKCCGVSVMVPGGEVARQRAPLLTGSVPPPHHMAGGAARREERGHNVQELWGARTSTHHLLALGCIRCLCVCCLAEHLLSRAVAWQSCRAQHPAPPRPRPLPRPEGEGPQAGGNNTASHAPPPGTLRIAEHPLNPARRRSNDLIVGAQDTRFWPSLKYGRARRHGGCV